MQHVEQEVQLLNTRLDGEAKELGDRVETLRLAATTLDASLVALDSKLDTSAVRESPPHPAVCAVHRHVDNLQASSLLPVACLGSAGEQNSYTAGWRCLR